MAITKVVLPNGKVDTDVGWGKPQRERVIPDWVASTVTQVLEQNMLYGTGTGAHVSGHTDAGKTGTTDNYADAWFSGFTPRLEATVWIGYPRGEVPMLDVHGIAVSGPTFPAQIWHLYMETAIGSKPNVPFPPATTKPVWTSWRGQYEFTGGNGATTTSNTTTSGTTVTLPPPPLTPNTVAPTFTEAPTTTVEPIPPPTTATETTATEATTTETTAATTTTEPPPTTATTQTTP
jgi:penicillin-binding protein 1A